MKRIVLIALYILLFAAPAGAQQFQAGETNIGITWQPNLSGTGTPTSLIGATVNMLFTNGVAGVQSRNCPVDPGGKTCTYRVTSSDFPAGGVFSVQFVATLVDGTVRKTKIIPITVGSSLE